MKNLFLLAALALTACRTDDPNRPQTVWYCPGKTPTEAAQDHAACELEQLKNTLPPQFYGGGFVGFAMQGDHQRKILEACLRSKGYQLTDSSSLTNGLQYPRN